MHRSIHTARKKQELQLKVDGGGGWGGSEGQKQKLKLKVDSERRREEGRWDRDISGSDEAASTSSATPVF